MTLNEIIVAALQQLRRSRDSQTIDQYRGAFTQYANMAQQDLSKAFPQFRTDRVPLQGGAFHIDALPRWCTKVIAVTEKGRALAFDLEQETGRMLVAAGGNAAAPEAVDVCYRFVPLPMENATDSPELPAQLHQCIVSYVVASERSEGDSTTQGSASIYFQLYNEQKRGLLRGGLGAPDSYRLKNYAPEG